MSWLLLEFDTSGGTSFFSATSSFFNFFYRHVFSYMICSHYELSNLCVACIPNVGILTMEMNLMNYKIYSTYFILLH